LNEKILTDNRILFMTVMNDVNRHVSSDHLDQLCDPKKSPCCVSIYLNTAPTGGEVRENDKRFRNEMDDAIAKMEKYGIDGDVIADFKSRMEELLEDKQFWEGKLNEGMAVLLSDDRRFIFTLPHPFEDQNIVDRQFFIKPLIPYLNEAQEFYVLSLSRDDVRFFHGIGHDLSRVEISNLTTSFSDYRDEFDYQRSRRAETGNEGSASGAVGSTTATPVSGVGDEAVKGEKEERYLEQFLSHIDEAVDSHLQPHHPPLYLIAEPELLGLFRNLSNYNNLQDSDIDTDPAHLSDEEIHDRIKSLLGNRRHDMARAVSHDILRRHANNPDQVFTNITELVKASADHRIDELLISNDNYNWGRFDPDARQVTIHDERNEILGEELTNLTIIHTLKNNGTVVDIRDLDLSDLADFDKLPDAPVAVGRF
jgi:hypothetical protein